MKQTLGTQLRHLLELLDGAVADNYAGLGMGYRPRYTPVMRALIERKRCSVGEIAVAAGITQPAATQTVALMIGDRLIEATASDDGRKKLVQLSPQGRALLPKLEQAWRATARAAESLDDELPAPLSDVLNSAIAALGRKPFGARIQEASAKLHEPVSA